MKFEGLEKKRINRTV